MIFKKNIKSFITVAIIGILAGSICATLDLIPGNNIWTFSSFSGSLGFWAISAMIILMQSDNWKLAGINTFIYFGLMNTSFFFVHLLLPLEFPRFTGVDNAAIQSLIWLIPSFICGICAIITYQAKKNNWLGIITLSLPLSVLLEEEISLIGSIIINHKYLFQSIIDLIGIIVIFVLYKDKKNPLFLILTTVLITAILLVFLYLKNGNILYY
jgi:hypothetical protein